MKINEKAKNFAAWIGLAYFVITLTAIVCMVQVSAYLVPGNFFSGLFTPGGLIFLCLGAIMYLAIPLNLIIFWALAAEKSDDEKKIASKRKIDDTLTSFFSFYFYIFNIAIIIIFINAQFGLGLF